MQVSAWRVEEALRYCMDMICDYSIAVECCIHDWIVIDVNGGEIHEKHLEKHLVWKIEKHL